MQIIEKYHLNLAFGKEKNSLVFYIYISNIS